MDKLKPLIVKLFILSEEFKNTAWISCEYFMRNIKVPVPLMAEQKSFVVKVETLESVIEEARAVIELAPAEKQRLLSKYL